MMTMIKWIIMATIAAMMLMIAKAVLDDDAIQSNRQ